MVGTTNSWLEWVYGKKHGIIGVILDNQGYNAIWNRSRGNNG